MNVGHPVPVLGEKLPIKVKVVARLGETLVEEDLAKLLGAPLLAPALA